MFGSRINQQKVEMKQAQNKELAFLFWVKLTFILLIFKAELCEDQVIILPGSRINQQKVEMKQALMQLKNQYLSCPISDFQSFKSDKSASRNFGFSLAKSCLS